MRSSRAAVAGGLLVLAVAAATVAPAAPGGEAPRPGDGETVLVARTVAGWPWPEMTASRVVAAAPAEVVRELLARVRAVLRRPGPRQRAEEFGFGDVRVWRRGRQVVKAGREVAPTRKEFDLLVYLLAHRGEVVTRQRLPNEVWGYERFPTARTVDTNVLRLRRKFKDNPDRPVWILTVHGQGYKFASA